MLLEAFLPKITQTLADPATNPVEKNKQLTLSFLPLARKVGGVSGIGINLCHVMPSFANTSYGDAQ